eukprot:309566-Hanusia_phi.AAC.1
MEILFVSRILKRRRQVRNPIAAAALPALLLLLVRVQLTLILGLEEKSKAEAKEKLDIPSLEEEEENKEQENGGVQAPQQHEPDLSFLRQGDIPKAVIEFALSSIPGDPKFLLSLLDVCEEAEEETEEEELLEELRSFLLKLMDENFWGFPGCMLRRAAREIKTARTRGFAAACEEVERIFGEYMKKRREEEEEEEKEESRKERDARWDAVCTFWKETLAQLSAKEHEEERKIATE